MSLNASIASNSPSERSLLFCMTKEGSVGEAQLAGLEDAHASFEQDIEHFNAQRDSITCKMTQAVALEAELKRAWLGMEKQVNALSSNYL